MVEPNGILPKKKIELATGATIGRFYTFYGLQPQALEDIVQTIVNDENIKLPESEYQ